MYRNALEYLNDFFAPRTVGYVSFNNGGSFVIAMKNLKKYRLPGDKKWSRWETTTPDFDNRCLQKATLDQITEEAFLDIMSKEDPRFPVFQANKKIVDSILGKKYFLYEVSTMFGTLPVISNEFPGENEVPCAHVYPGEMTDGLDAAPKKCISRIFKFSTQYFYDWLVRSSSEELQTKIENAILTLNRPEKFINWG